VSCRALRVREERTPGAQGLHRLATRRGHVAKLPTQMDAANDYALVRRPAVTLDRRSEDRVVLRRTVARLAGQEQKPALGVTLCQRDEARASRSADHRGRRAAHEERNLLPFDMLGFVGKKLARMPSIEVGMERVLQIVKH